ncbi:MAG: DUF3987 domain-containing protein, partial [Candidatus Riflebacteria bacterium]|nr:DUF3987 domain-containing protein [Candidatus Riflebacteria bacterium]
SGPEHDEALALAGKVAEYLVEQGWPRPVRADSGNGAHLLWRIDLPPADSELVKRCLEALDARFSSDRISVDRTVFNPSRIWKLYGTVARKGDPTPDRPHRLSRILDVPDMVEVVPREFLETLASEAPEGKPGQKPGGAKSTRNPGGPGRSWDVAEWVVAHGLEVRGPEPYQGGRRWVFKVCPWNVDHTNGSAFILELANGALSAGCHHNGCQDKGWEDLRDVIEPGWKDRAKHDRQDPLDDLNDPDEPDPGVNVEPDAAPFPVKVLPSCLQDYGLAESESVICPIDYVALTMIVVAGVAGGASRELEVKPGWTAAGNLFAAIVAPPASAKSPAMNAVLAPLYRRQRELDDLNREAEARFESEMALRRGKKEAGVPLQRPRRQKVVTTDATMEGLTAILEHNGRGLLYHADELSAWVRSMNAYRSAGKGADRENWLRIWQGQPIHLDRKTSGSVSVRRPFVSVLGCIPPDVLPALASAGEVEDGFTHRLCLVYPRPVPRRWTDTYVASDLKARWHKAVNALFALPFNGEAEVLRFSPQAKGLFAELASQHYREMGGGLSPMLAGVWGKADNHAARFAMVLQLLAGATGSGRLDAVEELSVLGGWALADYVKDHARKAYPAIRADKIDRQVLQALEWLRAKGGAATLREIYRSGVGNSKNARTARKLARELIDRGHCRAGKTTAGGKERPAIVLRDLSGSVR